MSETPECRGAAPRTTLLAVGDLIKKEARHSEHNQDSHNPKQQHQKSRDQICTILHPTQQNELNINWEEVQNLLEIIIPHYAQEAITAEDALLISSLKLTRKYEIRESDLVPHPHKEQLQRNYLIHMISLVPPAAVDPSVIDETSPDFHISQLPPELYQEHLDKIFACINPELSEERKTDLKTLLTQHAQVFSFRNQLGEIRNYLHHIILKPDSKCFRMQPSLRSHEAMEFGNKTIKELLRLKRILPSNSNYCSKTVVVPDGHTTAEGGKTFRLAIDYSLLNSFTAPIEYSLVGIDVILVWLRSRHNFLSICDISK